MLRLNGMIQPNQETLVKVTPRFPGVIRSMRKRLGDKVRKDEVLATVESNQSLTTYELKAPIDGTVIDRDGTLGEFASEAKPIFTIADLSAMWLDFAVFRRTSPACAWATPYPSTSSDGGAADRGEDRLSLAHRCERHPVGGRARHRAERRPAATRPVRRGRVVLSARPVDARSRRARCKRSMARPSSSCASGDTFEAREVELGGRDADWVEVTFGAARRRRLCREEQLRDQGGDRQGGGGA